MSENGRSLLCTTTSDKRQKQHRTWKAPWIVNAKVCYPSELGKAQCTQLLFKTSWSTAIIVPKWTTASLYKLSDSNHCSHNYTTWLFLTRATVCMLYLCKAGTTIKWGHLPAPKDVHIEVFRHTQVVYTRNNPFIMESFEKSRVHRPTASCRVATFNEACGKCKHSVEAHSKHLQLAGVKEAKMLPG